MASYSVAEAKNQLSRLIDRANDGEAVVITRHGKVVAEIRRPAEDTQQAPGRRPQIYEWLKAQRDGRKPLAIDSVQLLNDLHDETEV